MLRELPALRAAAAAMDHAAALSEQEIGHFDALDLSISTAAQRRFLGVVGAGRAHVAAVIEWCDGVPPASATLRLRLTNYRTSEEGFGAVVE